jgi:hypothetical protein
VSSYETITILELDAYRYANKTTGEFTDRHRKPFQLALKYYHEELKISMDESKLGGSFQSTTCVVISFVLLLWFRRGSCERKV